MHFSTPKGSMQSRHSTGNYGLRAVFVLCAFLLFNFSLPTVQADEPFKLRLYTHNIRYDNKNLVAGEMPWGKRRVPVSRSILENTKNGTSVVCLQEVLHNQLEDILSRLNKHESWAYFGVGRSDGKKKGEYAPILYKTSQWALVSSKTFWLSQTPEKPSKGWDATVPRIVTVVVLQDKSSGQRVKVLNTHMDAKGKEARRESAKFIISKMEAGEDPAFLCGDLNAKPTDEPYQILKRSKYLDSRTQVANIYEDVATFSGFTKTSQTGIIDYVWADPSAQWQWYRVLPNFFEFYMSDHRPVIADHTL